MKQFLALLISLCATEVFAAKICFTAKEKDKMIHQEGDCSNQYPPESTFKIALSLMGFNSSIFVDQDTPLWEYKNEYASFNNICKQDQTPKTWMRDSCLWYSQILTSKLGTRKFQQYVRDFNYGNMNLSGDKGLNNGLSRSWISSSLKISPHQQLDFLQNIIEQKLPVNKKSYIQTKGIMFVTELAAGWKLYGKTGSGVQVDHNCNKSELQQGWFVGYIQKGSRSIVFASHIADDKKENVPASFRARNEAFIKLYYIINELEGSKY
ncbi:hypothetical protein phytr_7130 [Candidatus Phycorickettsia trachydisci]|uniref:Beta-lactamase n=1 Tax=Candidatus Phycorickettsia trachydisci TaxID=2115978 RepID=A0A2P1P8Q9_9RICK|nr:class D beta-lactamase [Candidatus Phycorickettsia trachydisci]AVP87653.1 hypothetical protein phytr_7130 [Candidatus Phycorickettsia trachydisci]